MSFNIVNSSPLLQINDTTIDFRMKRRYLYNTNWIFLDKNVKKFTYFLYHDKKRVKRSKL